MATTYTSGVWLVREGEEDAFVAAWTEFTRWAAERDGAGTLTLVRDVDVPRRYLSFAPWTSRAAQEAWKNDPEFRGRIGLVRGYCEEFTPSVYEQVAEVQPGS